MKVTNIINLIKYVRPDHQELHLFIKAHKHFLRNTEAKPTSKSSQDTPDLYSHFTHTRNGYRNIKIIFSN